MPCFGQGCKHSNVECIFFKLCIYIHTIVNERNILYSKAHTCNCVSQFGNTWCDLHFTSFTSALHSYRSILLDKTWPYCLLFAISSFATVNIDLCCTDIVLSIISTPNVALDLYIFIQLDDVFGSNCILAFKQD